MVRSFLMHLAFLHQTASPLVIFATFIRRIWISRLSFSLSRSRFPLFSLIRSSSLPIHAPIWSVKPANEADMESSQTARLIGISEADLLKIFTLLDPFFQQNKPKQPPALPKEKVTSFGISSEIIVESIYPFFHHFYFILNIILV